MSLSTLQELHQQPQSPNTWSNIGEVVVGGQVVCHEITSTLHSCLTISSCLWTSVEKLEEEEEDKQMKSLEIQLLHDFPKHLLCHCLMAWIDSMERSIQYWRLTRQWIGSGTYDSSRNSTSSWISFCHTIHDPPLVFGLSHSITSKISGLLTYENSFDSWLLLVCHVLR